MTELIDLSRRIGFAGLFALLGATPLTALDGLTLVRTAEGTALAEVSVPDAVVTEIGPIEPAGLSLSGLAQTADGQTYAVSGAAISDSAELYRIDLATLQATRVGDTGIAGEEVTGLTADAGGELWLATFVDGVGIESRLYRIDPATGAAQFVGVVGSDLPVSSLAAVGYVLYGAAGELLELDRATGAGTPVTGTVGCYLNTALAYDGAGSLWSTGRNHCIGVPPIVPQQVMVRFDILTEDFEIQDPDVGIERALDTLVFVPSGVVAVPTMSSFGALLLGGLLAGFGLFLVRRSGQFDPDLSRRRSR